MVVLRGVAVSYDRGNPVGVLGARVECQVKGLGVRFLGASYSEGVQRCLAHKNPPRVNPTVALCLGTYGDPGGVGVSYERGTPVGLLCSGVFFSGSRVQGSRSRIPGPGFKS